MIGEYWDNHDLADIWEQTEPLELDVNIQSERKYYPIDSYISERLIEIAIKRGISPETLVNLWLQEKISQ